MRERTRCLQRHAHATAAHRDECDSRSLELSGYARLESVRFAPPPRVVIRNFPGLPVLLHGKLIVFVFSADEILPHERE